MATVVNSRDVYLQAYSPRVNSVQIQDNIAVDSGQIIGEGFEIIGSKKLRVYASTQVIKHYTATGDDISHIVITAIQSNLTGSVNLSIMSGTLAGIYSFGAGNNLTLSTTDITSDVLVLEVYTTEGSITYRDYVTIVRTREGSSSYVGYLTQECAVVPSDSVGNPLSYADVTGSIKIWQGTYDVTTAFTYTVHSNPDDLTISLGAATGVWSVSSGMQPVSSSDVTFKASIGPTNLLFDLSIVKIAGSYNGVRSNRQFSIPLNNVSIFSDSLATTIASADGGPVLGDLVTQFDTSGSFSKTKFWTGTSWVDLNAFVDGNLLVKGSVVAESFAGGTFQVGRYIKSPDWNGVVSSTGEITTPSTEGWIITTGNGSSIPSSIEIDAATIRGKLTTDQLQVGSVTRPFSYLGNAASGAMIANGDTPYMTLALPSFTSQSLFSSIGAQVKISLDDSPANDAFSDSGSVYLSTELWINGTKYTEVFDHVPVVRNAFKRVVVKTHNIIYSASLSDGSVNTFEIKVKAKCMTSTGAPIEDKSPHYVVACDLFVSQNYV